MQVYTAQSNFDSSNGISYYELLICYWKLILEDTMHWNYQLKLNCLNLSHVTSLNTYVGKRKLYKIYLRKNAVFKNNTYYK